MADQEHPPVPASPTPQPKPSRRKPMDQVRLLRKRRQKAKAVIAALPAPPIPGKPKLPTPALKPAQLKDTQPHGPAAPPVASAEAEREGNVLEQLFTMSLRRNEAVKPAEDVGMKLVQAIAESVSQAKPVGELDATMFPHLGEMSSKIHLMMNALNYHTMFERIKLYSLARWTLEKSLWQDLMNGQLSPVEKLALLQLSIKEMDKGESRISAAKDDLEKTGRGTMADIQTTTERVDRSVAKEDNTAMKELEGTSPVGREVARRLLDKASKVLDKKVQEAISGAPKGSSK